MHSLVSLNCYLQQSDTCTYYRVLRLTAVKTGTDKNAKSSVVYLDSYRSPISWNDCCLIIITSTSSTAL